MQKIFRTCLEKPFCQQTSPCRIHIVINRKAEGVTLRIGVIGTGNMGGMLTTAFARGPGNQLYIHNRTRSKAEELADRTPNIRVLDSAQEVAQYAETIFICTKSHDGNSIVQAIGPALSSRQNVATTISTVKLAKWESYTPAFVAKVIPSIVQTALSGVILVNYSPKSSKARRDSFEQLLRSIAFPFVVDEHQVRTASDLTSCGPAFVSYMLTEWASVVDKIGNLDYAQAELLLTQTFLGMANLLKSGMTFSDILAKVTIPGGVTEAGLVSMHEQLPQLFYELHQATSKHVHAPVLNLTSGQG
ncbi:NAD(P)-binding domain-containing protein [Alicyclobacillus tolerans]|nr:NAD(P)-binding domain-containing protein [Alicyclobacillus tolerans]